MSKKVLKVEEITNELEGASLFFRNSSPSPTVMPQLPPTSKDNLEIKPPPNPVLYSPTEHSLPSESEPELLVPELSTKTPARRVYKKTVRTTVTTKQRSSERINERSTERTRVRHSFDVFADQLLSLKELSVEEEKITGQRVLLGDLVQQALDMFISKYRNNDRPNE